MLSVTVRSVRLAQTRPLLPLLWPQQLWSRLGKNSMVLQNAPGYRTASWLRLEMGLPFCHSYKTSISKLRLFCHCNYKSRLRCCSAWPAHLGARGQVTPDGSCTSSSQGVYGRGGSAKGSPGERGETSPPRQASEPDLHEGAGSLSSSKAVTLKPSGIANPVSNVVHGHTPINSRHVTNWLQTLR